MLSWLCKLFAWESWGGDIHVERSIGRLLDQGSQSTPLSLVKDGDVIR